MKQAVFAVAALAVMASLLVMFKKRVDAEADGTAYASHEPTLGDRIFGRGQYAGGRALGTGASDSDGTESASPLDAALASVTGAEAESEAEAEAESEAEAEAESEAEAEAESDAETETEAETQPDDSQYRAEFDAMIAASQPAAVGLTAALGAEAAPLDDGGPEGFMARRRTADASVVIDAPVEAVWAYTGNSHHARDWSVYFDHITPLPGIPDGQVGALRRCFRKADETGRRWDERLVEVVPHRLRKIHVFGLSGFFPKGANEDEHLVWQIYEPLGPDRTRVTFRTRPFTEGARASFVALVSKRRTTRTFRENLENIKAAVEQGPKYRRPHAYWD